MNAPPIVAIRAIVAFAAAGALVGWVYFSALRHATRALLDARARIAMLLGLARVALVVLLFGAAARAGAWTLLAAVAGVSLARVAVLRREAAR